MDAIFTSQPASPNRGGLGVPAQEIPAQQIPIQPVAPSPTQQPPSNKKSFRKVFNISSWIILFALLPVTVLIFLSQNTVPGDLFYPVKRSLENVVLAAASVSPATRAAFRTDLTEIRFKEAQSLVASESNTSGLSTFIQDIQSTQLEVANLKDDTQRTKAEEKLISKLEEYQTGLSTLEAKTEQNIIAYQIQQVPTLTPTSPDLPSATPTLTPSPIPSKIPTVTPTSLPLPSSQPQSSPTLTSIPTVVQATPTVPTQVENTQITEQRKIVESIKDTKTSLEKIQKDLEEKRERRHENKKKERTDKRNEDEKKDSSNREK